MNRAPEVLLFDLFGTLVFFDDARLPSMDLGGRRVPLTVHDLPDVLAREAPGVTLERFFQEMTRVGRDIQARKRDLGIEIHTSVRFVEVLRGLGLDDDRSERVGRQLAVTHMDSLARAVVSPPGRRALLDSLSSRFRLGLLSNFDDGPTARRVLEEAGIADRFEAILISAEEGLRKPNASLFERACARMGAPADRSLYIGDTWEEDVLGASQAGLGVVWVKRRAATNGAEGVAASGAISSAALGAIEDVDDLPRWLEDAGLSAPVAASR